MQKLKPGYGAVRNFTRIAALATALSACTPRIDPAGPTVSVLEENKVIRTAGARYEVLRAYPRNRYNMGYAIIAEYVDGIRGGTERTVPFDGTAVLFCDGNVQITKRQKQGNY